MLVESFLVFLGVAGILVPIEFSYFALQDYLIAAGVPVNHPETWLDAHIPFIPEFIWPYWAYFGFLGVSVWLPRNRHDLARLAGGLLFVHFLGFASYLLYPTAMQRIDIACESLSCGMVGAMYLLDPGYGLFPSLHAACSVYVIMCAFAYRSGIRWFVAVFGMSIVFATVLVKQHYIVDVPAGIVLGIAGGRAAWAIVDRYYERFARRPLPDGALLQ